MKTGTVSRVGFITSAVTSALFGISTSALLGAFAHVAGARAAESASATSPGNGSSTPLGPYTGALLLCVTQTTGAGRFLLLSTSPPPQCNASEVSIKLPTDALQFLSLQGNNDVTWKGANLHVVNGLEQTSAVNGAGNIIIGYNESRGEGHDVRTGSHLLIVGSRNNYTGYGGIVAGDLNEVDGSFASVVAGQANRAFNDYSSISGGSNNWAHGDYSSISAGSNNVTYGNYSSISGGSFNHAGSDPLGASHSSISGGYFNQTNATYSSISGGQHNTAGAIYPSGAVSGTSSSISGGQDNNTKGDVSSISGGQGNVTGAPNSCGGCPPPVTSDSH
jgi:hypothetical protein